MKKWIIPVIVLVVLIVVATAAVVYVVFPKGKEEKTEKEKGKYEDITSWEDDYDSVKLEDVTEFEVGMHVYLGSYEQDKDSSNGKEPIIWRVIAVEDGRVLLLSEYVLDQIDYHDVKENVTWELCDLRKWLNGEFYSDAFTDEEKTIIIESEIDNPANSFAGTKGGEKTSDFCFVLSVEEIKEYLNVSWDSQKYDVCSYCGYEIYNRGRLAAPITAYANYREAVYLKGTSKCRHTRYMGFWWTRTPGATQKQVVYVRGDGRIIMKGDDVHFASAAVRPAMWINIK